MTAPAGKAGPVVRVREWAPPRGPRDQHGRWRWTLATRPSDSYLNDAERAAVVAYRRLCAALVKARRARGWSLRDIAFVVPVALTYQEQIAPGTARAPLSVLTGLEQGSSWPTFETLAAVALTLDHRLQVTGPAVRGTRRFPFRHGARVEASFGRVAATRIGDTSGSPVFVATPQRAWRMFAIYELLRRAEAAGLAPTQLARQVGLRPNTVSDLRCKDAITDTVGLKTLLAMAVGLGSRLEMVPRDRPWPGR